LELVNYPPHVRHALGEIGRADGPAGDQAILKPGRLGVVDEHLAEKVKHACHPDDPEPLRLPSST
jgi:hypothetical protein